MTHSSPFPPENFPEPRYVEPQYSEAAERTYSAPPQAYSQSSPDSTADVAKQQAGDVASGAADAGKHVAGVAQEQAQQVAGEVKSQAKDLLHQTKGELTDQAATQQKRLASGLRALGDELGSMARSTDNPGMASDLARQAAERSGSIAAWLEDREPGHVLDEVTGFARRRPGAFLALAAGAGLLAGRLGRGILADDGSNTQSPQKPSSDTRPQQTPSAARRIVPASDGYGTDGFVDAPPVATPLERPIQNTGYTEQPGFTTPNPGLRP